MVSELPWAQNWMSGAIENSSFLVFCKFSSDDFETIFWVNETKRQKVLNKNLVIGSFLENGFKATLSSKTSVLSVCKGHFSDFCTFLSDEVETVFWESKADPSKLFKFKVGHRKLLENCFEPNVPSVWKWYFSVFWKFLSDEVETVYWEKEDRSFKIIWIQSWS